MRFLGGPRPVCEGCGLTGPLCLCAEAAKPAPRIWATPARYQELRAALITDGAMAKEMPPSCRSWLWGVEIWVSADPRAEEDLRPGDVVLE